MKYIVCTYLLLAVGVADCQQGSGNSAKTSGACSPAITGTGNTITITTCNIDEVNTEKLKSFLSNILITQRSDTTEILSRLNSCLMNMGELMEGYWQPISDDKLLALEEPFRQAIPHPAKPTAMVYVENGQDDHNRGKLANVIIYTLRKAGWMSDIAHATILFGNSDQPSGIVIDAKAENSETADSIARALGSVFGDQVIHRTTNTDPYPMNTVEIHIWNKPR